MGEFLDVSVFVSVIVTSPVVLIVPDFTDSVACVDIVVCSVVIGASQSIRKTCAGSVKLSEVLQCGKDIQTIVLEQKCQDNKWVIGSRKMIGIVLIKCICHV